jgi:hypothetical protein
VRFHVELDERTSYAAAFEKLFWSAGAGMLTLRPDNINIDYGQDLPELKLSYGFRWFDGWSERTFWLQEVDPCICKGLSARL